MELNDALKHDFTDMECSDKDDAAISALFQAAKDMQAIAEARKKATGGEWSKVRGPLGYDHIADHNGSYLSGAMPVEEVTDFITTAANIAAKYTGENQ